MQLSPFHAMYIARQISEYAYGADRLIPAYASSNIEIFPYQIAAAMFALRSPYLKGAVLADEGSLGKTYEALLVISELYFEGRDRILIIVPTPLLQQWVEILENRFSVPFTVVDRNTENDGNPFDKDTVALTTYDYAVEKAELISHVIWNIVVFEEAHRLAKASTGENKTATVLKDAVGDAYKLLLTATPMQNSIMDLHGLITFIDEDALGDADEFYKRYFRKPENYGELTATARRYCFRTLRSQVESYVKIPNRLPVTADYPLSSKELKLNAMLDAYLAKPNKLAFPKMDSYDLTLMFKRAISSSPFALAKLLNSAISRVEEPELVEMAALASEIQPKSIGKARELIKVVKLAFAELKKKGANRKIIIFTESLATVGFLSVLLSDTYKILAFNGSKSRDYSVIKNFEREAEILITTDVAAEGFNLDFCSFIINYDLPYNVLTLEQRIMRCHRQGQQNDVVVLNFLSKQNFADVRMLELINKRVLQFDGIMGMSDDIVGNFTDNAEDGIRVAFEKTRHKKDIEEEFQTKLAARESENTDIVGEAENVLFTTFTHDVADKVTVTPQYIKDRSDEINAKLWELTKWFFSDRHSFSFDEESKTLNVGIQPPKVFTGAALRRREYSISDKTLSPASSIAKNMISEIYWRGIPDTGTVTIDGICDKCQIGFYRVKIKPKNASWQAASYYTFLGRTADEQLLSNSECRERMELPVDSFTTGGKRVGECGGLGNTHSPHELDELLDITEFLHKAVSDTDSARREEIESVTERARREKSMLGRELESLKNEIKQMENALSRTTTAAERVDFEKRRATANKSLKSQEQSLFMDGLKIDAALEQKIQELTDNANLTAEITRLFVIDVEGIS